MYSVHRVDRPSRGGGVCLFTSSKFRVSTVPINSDLTGIELLCVDLFLGSNPTRIILCYRPPFYSHLSCDRNMKLVNILDSLCNVTYPIVMLGDFNLPNISWHTNCIPSNNIDICFFEFFNQAGLSQYNLSATRHLNTLDLVFCNDENLIYDFVMLPPLGSSDHDMVGFSIIGLDSADDYKNNNSVPKRNYAKCNFDLMNANLFNYDWNAVFRNCVSADDHWGAFLQIISPLLDLCCPTVSPSKSRKSFNYPASTRRLSNEKIRAWHKLKLSPTNTTLLENYKIISSKYRNAVNKYHYDRESAVLHSKNSSDFYKFIRRSLHKPVSIPPLIDSVGNTITDSAAKADLLNTFFSSIFTSDDGNLPPFPRRSNIPPDLTIDDVIFSADLVLSKLTKLKKSLSNNPDTFPPIVLKSCAHVLASPLASIFNVIFNRSELPSSWLTSVVIPLFKKGQRHLPSNYRPISLTSASCKVMESIISDSLTDYLLSNNLLFENQHGFRKNHSTLTNLLNSTRHWFSSLNSRKSTDIIYIDFAKAFDSISHPKLLHKLKSYGISGRLVKWISCWLSGRSQCVLVDGLLSIPRAVLSGILQGSVLGPLFFILFINDLIDILPPESNPTLFADDLKLFSDEPCAPAPENLSKFAIPSLQISLNLLFVWSCVWQLKISFSKCSVLSISYSKNTTPRHYSIDSTPLPQVSSFCDLGIIIDDKLTFSAHIASITKKAYVKSKLIFRCFVSKNCNLLKHAYTTYVRPLVEYAIPVWSPFLLNHITIVENIQRRFTKSIPNLRTLSYSARLNFLGLDSLLLRRKQSDLFTCFRILHSFTPLRSNLFFSPRPVNITRGHQHVLVLPLCRINICKYSFQSRVVPDWNALPPHIVSADTFSAFKARITRLHLPST